MRIRRLDARRVQIPLRGAIEHARASRAATDNVVCAITLDGGIVGYGEGVPRGYVTGESIDTMWSALEALELPAAPPVATIGDALALAERAVARAIVDRDGVVQNACRAALELAILDAYGKAFATSLTAPLIEHCGTRPGPVCTHSLVLDRKLARDPARLEELRGRYGFRAAKLKVGFGADEDLANIATLRACFGPDGDLRLDANGAWTFEDAARVMSRARDHGVTVVEDPLRGATIDEQADDLRRLREREGVRVVLDEGIRTPGELARAIDLGAIDVVNLRVSKNGGLVRTCRLAKLAQDRGVGLQVGTQVGETAILSAAGRHLSYSAGPVVYLEGSNEQLKFEPGCYVAEEELTYDERATSRPLTGPGLGITVIAERLERFTTARLAKSFA
ncbi:MAG TPA: enolase C-terminal domain-like protein [Kofleriaceae bacterium]|nr:enolase C-terminal domain-like protein [Kofleriaceae bacterium]